MTDARFEQFRQGDQPSFRYYYDKYSPSICHFIRRSIDDLHASEDIMHDVFINLWKSRQEVVSEFHLTMFLYQSARHRCLNHLRQRRIDAKYRRSALSLDSEEDYTGAVIEEEVHRTIAQQIERLPEEQRKVIKLHLEGKNNMEIAEILNISVNTVRTHKARARKTLRETLDHLRLFLMYFNI